MRAYLCGRSARSTATMLISRCMRKTLTVIFAVLIFTCATSAFTLPMSVKKMAAIKTTSFFFDKPDLRDAIVAFVLSEDPLDAPTPIITRDGMEATPKDAVAKTRLDGALLYYISDVPPQLARVLLSHYSLKKEGVPVNGNFNSAEDGAIPEPASLFLFAAGAVAVLRRRTVRQSRSCTEISFPTPISLADFGRETYNSGGLFRSYYIGNEVGTFRQIVRGHAPSGNRAVRRRL